MSSQEKFSLEEIAQIALGGSDLNNVNISLLYTIIDLLIKKLNCENEKVILGGVAGEYLQELLSMSNVGPPLLFKHDLVKKPMKKYEELDKIEKQIEKLEYNLDEHIKYSKYVGGMNNNSYDRMPCTLYCEVEEPPNKIIGAMLKNNWLTTQLNEYLNMPLTCRFNRLEIKFRNLKEKMKQFKKDSIEAHQRIDKMEELFINLLEFQKIAKENYNEFATTMEEIQGVMNAKVNNSQIPPIKRNFLTLINKLTYEIEYMKYVKTRPRALLCMTEPPNSQDELSDASFKKFVEGLMLPAGPTPVCGCDGQWLHPSLLLDRLEVIDHTVRLSTSERVSFSYPLEPKKNDA